MGSACICGKKPPKRPEAPSHSSSKRADFHSRKPHEVSVEEHSASQMEGKLPSTPKQSSLQPVLIPDNTERLKHMIDVQQPVTHVKLYEVSRESQMLSFEKASPGDWQKTIMRCLNLSAASAQLSTAPSSTPNLAVKTQWDHRLLVETAGKVLSLPPRDWLQEQLALYREQFRPTSDMAVTARRKLVQLQEHFGWLVWAAAAYFYVSVAAPSPNLEVDLQREFGALLPINTEASFVSHPNSSMLSSLNFELPGTLDGWFKGFSFKGVFLRLAFETSREATVIKAECQAAQQIEHRFQDSQDSLSFSILFPLTAVVAFGPYVLYGSPVIPESFVGKGNCDTLEIPSAGRQPLVIPKDNLLQLFKASDSASETSSGSPALWSKPLYLLVNAHVLLAPKAPVSFLLYISCVGSEIKVMKLRANDPPLPPRTVALLKGEGKSQDLKRYRAKPMERLGWAYIIHTDPSDAVQRSNRVASLLDRDAKGDVMVTVSMKPVPSKRLGEPRGKDWRRTAVKRVVATLETTDCIVNHTALSELVRRHRLPQSFGWILASKIKDERSLTLLQTDILARTVKKFAHYYCESQGIRSFADYREAVSRILCQLLVPASSQKPLNEELLLLLFLSRLRVVRAAEKLQSTNEKSFSRVIANSKKKMGSFEFLLRHEVVKDVYTSAARAPGLFLSTSFAKARVDSFSFLAQEPVLTPDCITALRLRFEGKFDLRESAYFSLIKTIEQALDIQRTGKSLQSSAISRSVISEEEIELINREEEKLPQNFEVVLPSKLYTQDSQWLKESYELPPLSTILDCAANAETLFSDIVSVEGKEAVVAELLILAVTLTYFQERDANKCAQLLRKVSDVIAQCVQFPAELAIAYHLWQGIVSESSSLPQAEQHYVTALMLMTQLYGDPRGRGNCGIPWQLIAASKLSGICRDENRLQDAVLAEEHFDAVYISTKQYRKLSYAHGRWKHTNTRAEELSMKYPFEHWSTFSPNRARGSMSFDDPSMAENREGYFACMLQNHLPMFQTGVTWSNVFYKQLLSGLKLPTTGTVVDSLGRELKRPSLPQSTLSQVLAGTGLGLADLKGVVYIWGSNHRGQLGLSVNQEQPLHDMHMLLPRLLTPLKDEVIKEIAIGADHCVAVSLEGRAWSWGDNSRNQLGLGPDAPQTVSTPMLIKTINSVIQASCGYAHTLLLTQDAQVCSVGDHEKGLLGHGNLHAVFFPKVIAALKGVKVRHVECGGFHSMALTSEGVLYSWGEAQGGQLGLHLDVIQKKMQDLAIRDADLYIHTPTRLYGKLGNKKIIQVACGEAHTLALTQEGEVFAWGHNSNGQLGLGFNNESYVPGKGDELSTRYEPELVRTLSHSIIKKIAASGVYSMFINSENVVFACGANDYYKLGLDVDPGESKDIVTPTQLDVFRGYSISEVACGIDHALAIGTDPQRMLWSWGKNRDGQLGIACEGQYATPRPVQSLSNAALYKAACGSCTSLVIVGNPSIAGRRKPQAKDEVEQNWGMILSES